MASTPQALLEAVTSFLGRARAPAVLEPGEDLLPLTPGGFSLEIATGRLVLQAWDQRRSLSRRLVAIEAESPGLLKLTIERFGKRRATLELLDTARPQAQLHALRGHRKVFREHFRSFLSRQFCGWKIAELSAEPDLEHSLSPAYPRAFLRRGTTAWAAIAAPPAASDPSACLTYGLIWLDHLRARESRLALAGLAVFVPDGRFLTTALRLRHLRAGACQWALFAYTPDGHEHRVDPADCGNLDTNLPVFRRPEGLDHPALQRLSQIEGVEIIPQNDGAAILRLRGLPFAAWRNGRLSFGIDRKEQVSDCQTAEVEAFAAELARIRSPHASGSHNPLYRRYPEAWLESQVRANLTALDAALYSHPVYGQVPAFAGRERGVLDLLAAGRHGRLTVIELKASEDPHLPLQALDYWMRVAWHAAHNEFGPKGYFPGIPLTTQPPRLLLVSPALRFHPTSAGILSYFDPAIEVERVGLGLEWQRRLKVVFRASGAASPVWASEQDQQNAETNTA